MRPIWNTRSLWTLAVLALVLGVAVGTLFRRVSRNRAARAAVHQWIGTIDWWDRNGTVAENERRQLEALRGLGSTAVDVLRQDLQFDPAWMRLLQRFPVLQRFVGGPGPTDEPNEIRHRAIFHLGRLGPAALTAVPDVARLASDPDGRIRSEVAFTLGLLRSPSPLARTTLEALRTDADRDARFAAMLALWNLDRTNSTLLRQIAALITTNNLSWPSICLGYLGPDAAPFAPTLRRAMLQSEWSMARAQALRALWLVEGDQASVLSQLAGLEAELPRSHGTTPTSRGLSPAESSVAHLTEYLMDEREFRSRIRPMLRQIRDNPESRAQRFATIYLQKFDELDRRGSGPAAGDPAPGALPPRTSP